MNNIGRFQQAFICSLSFLLSTGNSGYAHGASGFVMPLPSIHHTALALYTVHHSARLVGKTLALQTTKHSTAATLTTAKSSALFFPKATSDQSFAAALSALNPSLNSFTTASTVALLAPRSARALALFDTKASLPGPGSLATRQANAVIRTVVKNNVKAGEAYGASQSSGIGGVVTGGQLEGNYYVANTIPGYDNTGEFTGTVGTIVPANFQTNGTTLIGPYALTPNFQNILTFASSGSITKSVGGIGLSYGTVAIFSKISGAQRAALSHVINLSGKSFAAGEQLAKPMQINSPITGGLFVGTLYRNNMNSSPFVSYATANANANYAFAFGNNPSNNPAAALPLTLSNQSSYITFANGQTKTISSGQIVFPMVNSYGLQSGSVFTFGSNPANSSTLNQTLTNLTSFIDF